MSEDKSLMLTDNSMEALKLKIKLARKAKLLPAHITSDEQAMVVAIKGLELGIPAMQAFSQVYVVNGQPTCSAQLMLGLAYRHIPGFELVFDETNANKCVGRARRSKDREWVKIGFDMEDAKRAKLAGKGPWTKHPDDMLRARVVSKLMKMVAPDVFAGLYLPDEMSPGIEFTEPIPTEAKVIDEDKQELAKEAREEQNRAWEASRALLAEFSHKFKKATTEAHLDGMSALLKKDERFPDLIDAHRDELLALWTKMQEKLQKETTDEPSRI